MKPPSGSRGRAWAEALAVFVVCTALFYFLLTRKSALMDPDALFHYKVSSLLLRHGPWVDISWLPFTILGERGTDHQWFFHALVAPFTLLGNGFAAVSFTAAAIGAMVPAFLLLMLRRASVPWAPLFAVATMFASDLLPGRFLMLRAQDLAVVLMVAALFALVQRRAAWVGVLAFVFMESYHAAVILGALAVIAMGVQGALERRIDPKPLAAVLLGIGAGLLVSPWFPRNVDYLIFHTFSKAATGMPHLVGTEWYRVPIALLVTESLPAHLLLFFGGAAVATSHKAPGWPRLPADTLAFLATTLLFLAMYHFAWRFAEYYVPFAVVTSALLWRDAMRMKPPAGAEKLVLPGVLAVLLAWGLFVGAQRMEGGARFRFEGFADMMRHVDANDPKPIIFNSHWPGFVRLFYWSDRARYVAGLDGHYLLYGPDPKRFMVWNAIATGSTAGRDDNSRLIRKVFDAGWAVIPRGHDVIADALKRDGGAQLVMENEDGWLFRLNPA